MENDIPFDEFIFAPSKIEKRRRAKGFGRGGGTFSYEPEEEEEEWVSKDIEDQISSTISSIEKKVLRDETEIFIVLGLTKQYQERERVIPKKRVLIFDSDTNRILERLSANILAYLVEEHNKLLISCPLSALIEFLKKERYSTKYFQKVKRISPLLYEEQVSEYLRETPEWFEASLPVLIQLIPNVTPEKRDRYLAEIIQYLQEEKINILDIDEEGFIIANLNKESTSELLLKSNTIFKVDGVPQGVISSDNHAEVIDGNNENQSKLSDSEIENLPIICLMDSGVNDIPPLHDLIIFKDGYRGFHNNDDGYSHNGHGTPVACLASYGEKLVTPKARILSYKLFDDNRKDVVFQGLKQAINRYSNRTRIFLSSINFNGHHPEVTALLERLIQERNICMVYSAGNIDEHIIHNHIARGTYYPNYILSHSVLDPSQAVTIISVGAISKKESQDSIARVNQVAPFSRCGISDVSLCECPKPEFVQHGGNLCSDRATQGLGVGSYTKFGSRNEDFVGTSFSAPLFAHRIAEIEAKYGSKITNVETLKAIVLASTSGIFRNCLGYGETSYFCDCDYYHTLIFSEGLLSLPDTSETKYITHSQAEITVTIPKFIEKIDVFLVHSDNHTKHIFPCLNTYLKVYATKTGRERGYVRLVNPEELNKRSHMKMFRWAFQRKSMEGDWTFIIRPEITVDMLEEHRMHTIIRYGCAILITAKTTLRFESLSKEILTLMRQRGYL